LQLQQKQSIGQMSIGERSLQIWHFIGILLARLMYVFRTLPLLADGTTQNGVAWYHVMLNVCVCMYVQVCIGLLQS
jgi:hypothetical protein